MFANVVFTESVNVLLGTSTQQKDLDIGTTTAHIGGSFSLLQQDSCPGCTITSITITENGTVDAQNDLDNIQGEFWFGA